MLRAILECPANKIDFRFGTFVFLSLPGALTDDTRLPQESLLASLHPSIRLSKHGERWVTVKLISEKGRKEGRNGWTNGQAE